MVGEDMALIGFYPVCSVQPGSEMVRASVLQSSGSGSDVNQLWNVEHNTTFLRLTIQRMEWTPILLWLDVFIYY